MQLAMISYLNAGQKRFGYTLCQIYINIFGKRSNPQ
jgi:hypothetical protein